MKNIVESNRHMLYLTLARCIQLFSPGPGLVWSNNGCSAPHTAPEQLHTAGYLG